MISAIRLPLRAAFCAFGICLILFTANIQAGRPIPSWDLVASTEMTPPGETSDLRFGDFYHADVNPNGQVVFGGTVKRGNITRANAIWIADNGSITRASREGDFAPGFPDTRMSIVEISTGDGSVNDRLGNIMFEGALSIGGEVTDDNRNGIWFGKPGDTLAPIVRTGQQAPGTPTGAVFANSFGQVAMNNAERIAFDARLKTGEGGVTTANRHGLWLQNETSFDLIAREGDPAPGVPGSTFADSNASGVHTFDSLVLTDGGHVGFIGHLNSNRRGIWFGPATNLQPVALDNGPAPGIPGARLARVFTSVALPDFAYSQNGSVAFWYRLEIGVGGVTSTNANALWAGRPGQLEVVARQGMQVPGLPAGVAYGAAPPSSDPFRWPAINDANQIAFAAYIHGPEVTTANNTAFFFGVPGDLKMIAREGDPVPGAGTDIVLGDLIQSLPQLTDNGQLIFTAELRGAGTSSSPSDSVWLYDEYAGLRLLAFVGQETNFGMLGNRTLEYILPIESGRASSAGRTGLTDSGLLLVRAGFEDGTQALLTANLGVPVPEPASISLVAALVAAWIVYSPAKHGKTCPFRKG
jgi:hypothetical protein